MAVLFDLDGVFYRGDAAIAGAAEVADWLDDQRINHLFLTNTTSRPRQALVEKLAGFGIETTASRVLTPPVAAVQWCQQHLAEKPVALFVPSQTVGEFDALPSYSGSGSVGAVIVGDLAHEWDFDVMNRAFRLLMDRPQPALLALGMTRFWASDSGLQLDVAPFVIALAHASGVQPVVLGKPDAAFYRAALDGLGCSPDDVVMVGDDIRGDIEAAQRVGLTAVLVRTGKFRAEDLDSGIRPDAVLDSVADFPGWYAAWRGGR